MFLEPCPPDLFFSKKDPADQRLGDLTRGCSPDQLPPSSIVIWGAPDDEGIRLNGGRPGAALAPEAIRRVFYKMTPSSATFPKVLHDLGNIPLTTSLAERHEISRCLALQLHTAGHFCLSLGGGHDYGFPDSAGFVEAFRSRNPLVINFDAHLDVRPSDQGFHSGTPFRRLLEAFAGQFEFWELGLQPQCNSLAHAAWAESQGAKLVFLEQLLTLSPENLGLSPDPKRPCFLSVDLDVFSSKEAPGCSQSWATGLLIESFLPWLDYLIRSFDVRGLGFYETSPPLDTDNRTSKLTALLMFHALSQQARAGK